eukprot:CAMPEP_0194783878 /NCGR_PEP_ID=MMETSP0323_2-20130528/79462_1 /TAXON_ID=2866 ORGANISM="Crypthecodinium cohnii, Strain Seligo" /NCGR_SAMPLE_ID=MMETSP0323_2 /ASSEMBLY_ACC=CAM_ASM_000346 /LENGTH=77 /DNA_ID=CAMNT_0039722801 /DNA_START=201 /DNA_END=434 /DNA_ORIENTATION=+
MDRDLAQTSEGPELAEVELLVPLSRRVRLSASATHRLAVSEALWLSMIGMRLLEGLGLPKTASEGALEGLVVAPPKL